MKKAVLTLLLLGLSSLSAYECCQNFSLYVDYLYWEVCESGLRFNRSSGSVTTTEFVNPDYQSGWRIGGKYQCECWDFALRYTSYENESTFNITNPPFTAAGKSDFNFDLDVVDIEFGYRFSFGCNIFALRPFVGTKLLWIDERFFDVPNNNRTHHKLDSYGLYFGSEVSYQIDTSCYCPSWDFAFRARGSYGILRGMPTHSIVGSNNTFNENKECLYISNLEGFVGLEIGYDCFECFTPHITVGYETNVLINTKAANNPIGNISIGYGGLVTRFQVDF